MSFGNDVEIVRMAMMTLLLPVTLVVENGISSLDLNTLQRRRRTRRKIEFHAIHFYFVQMYLLGVNTNGVVYNCEYG